MTKENNLVCSGCLKIFKTRKEMIEHWLFSEDHLEDPFVQNNRDKLLKEYDKLKIKEIDKKKKYKMCPSCGKKIKEGHVCSFKCPVCEKDGMQKTLGKMRCLNCGYENLNEEVLEWRTASILNKENQ